MSGNQSGICPPNYTQIPNEIIDRMHEMHESELRVLLAVARSTFGWQKEREQLSLARIMELTGMSKPGVMAGIEAAIGRKLMERRKAGPQSYSYCLLVKPVYRSSEITGNPILPVKQVDRSTQFTGTGKASLPEPVRQDYRSSLLNKDLKKGKKHQEEDPDPDEEEMTDEEANKQAAAILLTFRRENGHG